MRSVDAVRSSILTSLGLGVLACSSEPARPTTSEVVMPPPPAAEQPTSSAPVAVRRPTAVGYVKGRDGTVQRTGPEQCSPEIQLPACRGDERSKSCSEDTDCKEGAYGRCVSKMGQRGDFCGCEYSCASDSDCRPDDPARPTLCVCGHALPSGPRSSRCVPAKCSNGADCEAGECAVLAHDNGCGYQYELACRTESDTCRTDDDCIGRATCSPTFGGTWGCSLQRCVVGRPLLVEGRARVAERATSRAWRHAELNALQLPRHAVAARHWLAIAALEHASVGSFARFSLQLLALGAPADLLTRAQQAALDEVEHARLAYSVATALGAGDLGPGPLPHATAPIDASLEAVVDALVHEGCVGETLGAVEALEQAEAAVPELARVLLRIADDERRHAELAWSTLAWLRQRHGEKVDRIAARALAEAERALEEPAARPRSSAEAPELGLLGPDALAALRRQAFSEAVRPIARALLVQAGSA